jgi:hypothetical protein
MTLRVSVDPLGRVRVTSSTEYASAKITHFDVKIVSVPLHSHR